MPVIFRRPRPAQPQDYAGITPDLVPGLILLNTHLGVGVPRNEAPGNRALVASVITAPTLETRGGIVGAVYGAGATIGLVYQLDGTPINALLAATGEATVLAVHRSNAQDPTGNAGPINLRGAGSAEHYPFIDGNIYLGPFAGDRWINGYTPQIDIFKPHAFAASHKSGSQVAFLAGKQIATASRAETPAISTAGLQGYGSNGADYLFLLWNRVIPASVLADLTANPWKIFQPRARKLYVEVAGAGAHTSTGALTAQSATVAGTAAHLTLHTSAGALAAQSATVAGVATHPHLSTGALAAQSATVAGTAAHRTLHTSSGALAAGSATVAGTAAHTATSHASTGALAAQAAVIAGLAARLALHASTGALSASPAVVAGVAVHTPITPPPSPSPAPGPGTTIIVRPPPRVDISDIKVDSSGRTHSTVTRPWSEYFDAMFKRIGGSSSVTLTELAELLQTMPQISQLAHTNIEPYTDARIQALEAEVAVLRTMILDLMVKP